MNKIYRSLVINPGSTSTKIGVFENEKLIKEITLRHTAEELAPFAEIADQFDFRKNVILESLEKEKIDLHSLDFIMARGGFLRPLESGVYRINEKMKQDLRTASTRHASNLGALIADAIATSLGGIPAMIADPIVVDEMEEVARISGHPKFVRKSIFHALNQKAMARKYAEAIGRPYEELNLLVAHMGGGVSVGAHRKGRVIDVNQTVDGEGPFSPERSGTLPTGDLAEACFSGRYTRYEMLHMLNGKGGMLAYLGTSDAREAVKMAKEGDKKAALVLEAFSYQVAKTIGEMATVLCGEIDQIILTGGIAYNEYLMERLIKRISFLAPITRYPGEDELSALALGGYRVVTGRTAAKEY